MSVERILYFCLECEKCFRHFKNRSLIYNCPLCGAKKENIHRVINQKEIEEGSDGNPHNVSQEQVKFGEYREEEVMTKDFEIKRKAFIEVEVAVTKIEKKVMELDECPFCHSIDLAIHQWEKTYQVSCCTCRAKGPMTDTQVEAITRWNNNIVTRIVGE